MEFYTWNLKMEAKNGILKQLHDQSMFLARATEGTSHYVWVRQLVS